MLVKQKENKYTYRVVLHEPAYLPFLLLFISFCRFELLACVISLLLVVLSSHSFVLSYILHLRISPVMHFHNHFCHFFLVQKKG